MAFLTYIFLMVTPYLGHPNWEHRELATDILSYCLPFSYKALELNLTNEEPEVYKRTLSILKGRWYGKLEFDFNYYKLANELIYTDYEDEYDLPWIPGEQSKKIQNDLTLIKTIRFIHSELIKEDIYYYNEEQSGIDDVRFFVRGLKPPYSGLYEENIKLWKENKKTWRKK